jgi:2'-5' RNA ligase
MNKVHSSAVVIIPPKEYWESIQEIRKIYDRNINRWMPHITLLYPFRPRNQYEDVQEVFTKVCKNINPFEVSLTSFSFFSHGRQKYTFWLDPEPNILIIDLQQELLKIVPDCNDVNKYKNGFRPHLSLGQVKGKTNIHHIINELQANWKVIKFTLNKIYFISRVENKNSNFKISEQFQFKRNN